MLYNEDSNPEEDQNQLMETENLAPAEAPVKEGMEIAAAPENNQPATPRYVRADDDSEEKNPPAEDSRVPQVRNQCQNSLI